MDRTALFSPCHAFRYRLHRRWAEGPTLAFVLLNPSVANEQVDDATMRRCIGFALRGGYGALEVLNLYAYLATDPAELRRAGYPVGPDNDAHIAAAVGECDRVVVGWGARARAQCRKRADEVLGLLRGLAAQVYCLRLTRSGYPEHPLRLPLTCGLSLFGGQALGTLP